MPYYLKELIQLLISISLQVYAHDKTSNYTVMIIKHKDDVYH